MREITEIEHNVEACYSSDGERYSPTLLCSCGFKASEFNWEEAGSAYDAHLAEPRS